MGIWDRLKNSINPAADEDEAFESSDFAEEFQSDNIGGDIMNGQQGQIYTQPSSYNNNNGNNGNNNNNYQQQQQPNNGVGGGYGSSQQSQQGGGMGNNNGSPMQSQPPQQQQNIQNLQQQQQGGIGIVSSNLNTQVSLEIQMITPKKMEDARKIANHVIANKTVIVNFEETNKEVNKRILDFLTGVVFVLHGEITKSGDKSYIVTPANAKVTSEARQRSADDMRDSSIY